jgi:hypothetical protein
MEQKLTPAISLSSLVSERVSNGAAAWTMPSPILETPVAANCRQKFPGSRWFVLFKSTSLVLESQSCRRLLLEIHVQLAIPMVHKRKAVVALHVDEFPLAMV